MRLFLVVAALVFEVGCGSKKSPSEGSSGSGSGGSNATGSSAMASLKQCGVIAGMTCNFANCGGNSALINAFPVHGFRANGDCNRDQMQLVPGSMEPGPIKKCKGMTLDIEGDKLIGTDGTNKCVGLELEGASFEIRTLKGTERITIEEVTEYPVGGQTFPAYKMIWKDNHGKKTALCAKGGQKLREDLGVAAMKWSDDLLDPARELVIPIVSELYTDEGKAVGKPDPDWADQSTVMWNHLACVDDALAKRSMYGHYKPADPAGSRAALRMWTADYCGGRPFTMRGRQFAWSGSDPTLIEAQWNEDGASCLTRPRILFNGGKEEAPAANKISKLLTAFCKSSGNDCTLAKTWIDEAKNCTKANSTSKVDHGLPDCTPCSGSGCPLQSYNVK